jgi:hypothetical protein
LFGLIACCVSIFTLLIFTYRLEINALFCEGNEKNYSSPLIKTKEILEALLTAVKNFFNSFSRA